jgi:hypothetical protein
VIGWLERGREVESRGQRESFLDVARATASIEVAGAPIM